MFSENGFIWLEPRAECEDILVMVCQCFETGHQVEHIYFSSSSTNSESRETFPSSPLQQVAAHNAALDQSRTFSEEVALAATS